MKKITALLLCLVLLGCCAAFAEATEKETIGSVSVNGNFTIKCRLPEGYGISITDASDSKIEAMITSEDPAKPEIQLTVVFNEEYAPDGVRMSLNDVSEEDMALIRESFEEETEVFEYIDAETAHGTKLLIVKGALGDMKYVDFYSIYNSYEIEVIALAGAEAESGDLTDEQIQMIIDFLSDMDFEEA